MEYPLTKAELDRLVKTRQDFIDGKTTARNWNDIEDDLLPAEVKQAINKAKDELERGEGISHSQVMA